MADTEDTDTHPTFENSTFLPFADREDESSDDESVDSHHPEDAPAIHLTDDEGAIEDVIVADDVAPALASSPTSLSPAAKNGTANNNNNPEDIRRAMRVKKIVSQTVSIFKKNGLRQDTLFYKVVLGGNVRITKEVIEHMKSKEMFAEVTWLLGTRKQQEKFKLSDEQKKRMHIIKWVMFLLISFIFTLLTPVFYALHSVAHSWNNRKKHRLVSRIELPIAFAIFSKNVEIIEYFISEGVSLSQRDSKGNSIFHYIGDLSAQASDRAKEVFESTVEFINNYDKVRKLLTKHKNSAGLTAIEYTTKFGSTDLLTDMFNYPKVIQHTAFAVGEEDVSFGDTQTEDDFIEDGGKMEVKTKVEYIDVTTYEGSNISQLSYILNLLSDRDIVDMSETELQLFDSKSFVGRWVDIKSKQMLFGVGVLHVMDIMVTILIMTMLSMGFGGSLPYLREKQFQGYRAMNLEMIAISESDSTMFLNNSVATVIDSLRSDHLMEYLKQNISNNDNLKKSLLAKTVEKRPDLAGYIRKTKNLEDVTAMPVSVLDGLFVVAMDMPEFQRDFVTLYFWTHLQDVRVKFAQYVAGTFFLQALFETMTHRDREDHYDELVAVYNTFTMNTTNQRIFKPSEQIPFKDFQTIFCINKKHFTQGDIKIEGLFNVDGVAEVPSFYDNEMFNCSCTYRAYVHVANNECPHVDPNEVYNIIERGDIDFTQTGENLKTYMAVVIIALMYVVLDVIERYVHVFTCLSDVTYVKDMISIALSKKVPGSYMRKQINIFTYLNFCVCIYIKMNTLWLLQFFPKTVSADEVTEYSEYFLITGVIFRFVMHIHDMRLLPNIGYFVNTTFMMMTNLLHFSAVFGIVVVIFSQIFAILMLDPECPVKKKEGFEDIFSSVFQTFQLTFGLGETDAYTDNTSTPVLMAYVIFIIISGLLLLNLIIAIMSTTAESIMTSPVKETVWRIEWLDESLSAEYTFTILGYPLFRCIDSGYWTYSTAGFHVKKSERDGTYRVYIEVFHCKALST